MFSIRVALLFTSFLSLPLGARSLSVLLSETDTVVIGTEFNPVQAGSTFTFNLRVDRVMRGNVPNGATLNVVWNSRYKAQLGYNDDKRLYRGIWFLKKAENGGWECISAGSNGNAEFFFELSLPVADGPLPAELAYSAAATPLVDQILLEAAAGPLRTDRWMLQHVAAGMKSPGALRAFRYLAKSQAQDQVLMAIDLLLEADDTGGLLAVEAMAANIKPDVSGVGSIVFAIKSLFKGTDPAAIASLGRMATSERTVPPLRDASADALRRIHSPAAVPWLGLLINSDSEQMQIYGAQGLSYFANGLGGPAPQTPATMQHLMVQPSQYRTDDTQKHIGYVNGQSKEFVQYWKAWWNQHAELHISSPQ